MQPNTSPKLKPRYDVVIMGGGHNGLVAAAYLAQAGLSVLILERQAHLGGAAISSRPFAGLDVRLSRYSYLVSLLPPKIIRDLDLHFETRRRSIASFTPFSAPFLGDHQAKALLISNISAQQTEASFSKLPTAGNRAEYAAYQRFSALMQRFAQIVWPTLLKPLLTRDEMAQQFTDPDGKLAWEMLIEQPLGIGIERMVQDDLVRGTIFTDAKIGVLTHPHDPTLVQNRTFLYHIIGNGNGEWRVPVGGMGALTAELERVARSAGAEIALLATVEQINPGPHNVEITFRRDDGRSEHVQAGYALTNVAPAVLASLLPDPPTSPPSLTEKPEGSVFKINMLLKRLPQLKAAGYTAEDAFTGTFHIDEGYAAMQDSYHSAAAGILPPQPPGEMYCHSLTDDSILSPELRAAGYQTLTLFGLDMPYRLFKDDNAGVSAEALRRYLLAVNRYLAEPIEDCLALDSDGKPCLEAKSPVDLENDLNLPAGHIFHRDLTWPFANTDQDRGTWGVEMDYANVFICGAGAQRGGGVSGIPGHNAAMKVLDCLKHV